MLGFGLFALGLAAALACAWRAERRAGSERTGNTHSVGLNGVLVSGY